MLCITILYHATGNTVAIPIHVGHNGKFAMGVIMSRILYSGFPLFLLAAFSKASYG